VYFAGDGSCIRTPSVRDGQHMAGVWSERKPTEDDDLKNAKSTPSVSSPTFRTCYWCVRVPKTKWFVQLTCKTKIISGDESFTLVNSFTKRRRHLYGRNDRYCYDRTTIMTITLLGRKSYGHFPTRLSSPTSTLHTNHGKFFRSYRIINRHHRPSVSSFFVK